ncbi:pentatricopeptide repeat-containing protein, partial [Acrasis kona]
MSLRSTIRVANVLPLCLKPTRSSFHKTTILNKKANLIEAKRLQDPQRAKKKKQPTIENEPSAAIIETVEPTDPKDIFRSKFLSLLERNSYGDVAGAVKIYEHLKEKHQDELNGSHYISIIGSFAPRKLMFGWFKPYKDYVDMYHESGKFRAQERMDEALQVWSDMRTNGIEPTTLAYNTLMKVQLTCGKAHVKNVFQTYNQLVSSHDPDMASFSVLLKACTILETVPIAEEIYRAGLQWSSQNKNRTGLNTFVGIQFHNALLDVYSESRHPKAFSFYEHMIAHGYPVDGITFNTFAKACIFMDQRIKLPMMSEVMRVEGVMSTDLSQPSQGRNQESLRNTRLTNLRQVFKPQTKSVQPK